MKRLVLLCAIASASLIALYFARSALTPLFIGGIFSYLLVYPVRELEKKGVSRLFALSCVYLMVTAVIVAAFWIGVPYLITGLKSLQRTAFDYIGGVNLPFDMPHSLDAVLAQLGDKALGYVGNAAAALTATVGALINIAVGLVISFYLILDRETIRDALLGLIPKGGHRFTANVTKSIGRILNQFLLGQLGVALVVSGLLFAGLTLLRVKNALLLAVFAGVCEIIPYFGAVLGAVPAVMTAAAVSPQKAIWTAILFIAVQQLEGAYISPKILGNYVGLHPIITIMAVIVGGNLFGFAGMLFAVPACGIIKSIAGEIIDTLGRD